MKKIFSLMTVLLCAGWQLSQADAGEAVVVAATGTECSDYFVVKTGDEYALLEWFSGHVPDKGDKVVGEFNLFGFRNITLQPAGEQIRVYLEDYGLSLDDASDKLNGKCN
jgi:hypothetical protein